MDETEHTITEWTIHPVKENKVQAFLVSAILFGVAYALALLTGNLLWTLFYLAIFIISLHKYFFQTQYRLTENTLVVERPWRRQDYSLEEFRSFAVAKNGIQLNRFEHDSFYDRIRGVFILTRSQQEQVIRHLQSRLKMVSKS